MTSAIDATKPVAGSPTTQSVRDNFATAKSEISALQAAGPYLPLVGGTINGSPGSLVIGIPPGSAPSRGTLIVNANVTAPPPSATLSVAEFVGADGGALTVDMHTFGGGCGILAYRANGTNAAPTALLSGQGIGNYQAVGRGATNWFGYRGGWFFTTTENWTDTAQGTNFTVATTPTGTAGPATNLTLDGSGNLTILGGTATKAGGGAWVAPSDPALKTAVEPYTDGLDALRELQPIRYAYNGRAGTPDDGRQYVGLDAEAAAAAMPSLVGEMTHQPTAPNDEGELVPEGAPETYRTVDPSELVFTLINAVRELSDRLAALEAGR